MKVLQCRLKLKNILGHWKTIIALAYEDGESN